MLDRQHPIRDSVACVAIGGLAAVEGGKWGLGLWQCIFLAMIGVGLYLWLTE